VLRKEKIVEKDNPSQALILAPWPVRRAKLSSSCFNCVSVPSPSPWPLHLLRRRTRTGGILQVKGEDLLTLSRRQYHIEPGPLEKALLAEDAALKPFKSYKQSVKKLKKIGNILTIVVVA
ncbi:hypothetical protein S83_003218, partial [Arachis hypogaea]